MEYLEERGIIHRDLAARNVLGNYGNVTLLGFISVLVILTETKTTLKN